MLTDRGSGDVTLTGYRFSVYTRSLRVALAEKGVRYVYEERNPFDPADRGLLKKKHPFGLVPVLQHGGFRLWETAPMLDYVNAGFSGAELVPRGAKAAARMRQTIAIMDNYAYWPLVRQVFSHAVFRPYMGEENDLGVVQEGLKAAPAILTALEEIAAEGLALARGQVCLAACHVLPMLDYFTMLPEGARMVERHEALITWLEWMRRRASAIDTRPTMMDQVISDSDFCREPEG